MIDAAAGDRATLQAVVDAAKKTNPDSLAEIDALVAGLAERAKADKETRMASESFFEGWHGKRELGGSISTGNTSERAIAAGLGFEKETLHWRHTIDLIADYQKTEGTVTEERYFGVYPGAYKFNERFYAIGVLPADKFVGIESRFVESVGLGYVFVDRPDLKFSAEAGPALRQTSSITPRMRTPLPGGSPPISAGASRRTPCSPRARRPCWPFDTNLLESTTAIPTKLSGNLSGRASYNIRYETDPPFGRTDTDTTTRLTVVYSF